MVLLATTMFIRFRKVKSSGREPIGVHAKIFWYAQSRARCRWCISAEHDDSPRLEPYRLNVGLAENTRRDGKVKQEHVALLGSIDGYLLPEFFADIDPEFVEGMKSPEWERRSLRARANFWETATARLKTLDNRLGEDVKRIRMAIHARISWPMEPERELLELLDAKDDLKLWMSLHKMSARSIQTNEHMIDLAKKQIAGLHQDSLRENAAMVRATERVKQLSKR